MQKQSLYNPYCYNIPYFFVNMNFMPFGYQNIYYTLPFDQKLQKIQTQNLENQIQKQDCLFVLNQSLKNNQMNNNTEEQQKKTKKVQAVKIEANLEQQFEANKQACKSLKIYKKKNTESNIMNQTFSFIRQQSSIKLVKKLLGDDENKVRQYYRLINRIKKQNKKYVNRKFIKGLIEFEIKTQYHRVFDKCKLKYLSLEDIRLVLRKLIFYYLRNLSPVPLLTSTKINKKTIYEHFWRKRQIFAYIFYKSETEESQ